MNLCFIIGKHKYVYKIPYIFLKHVINKKKNPLNYEIISIKPKKKNNNNYTFNKTCLFLYNFFGKAEPLTRHCVLFFCLLLKYF